MVFDEVATSPAFVSRSQFYNAFVNAKANLPFPDNTTHLDIFQYPTFINSAILIGEIGTAEELAMYFAQVLYETNGLAFRLVPPCSSLGNCTTCRLYTDRFVNNTGGAPGRNYYGRGHLWLQGASEYRAASRDLFQDERLLLRQPDLLVSSVEAAWAAAAWKWKTRIRPLLGGSNAFGLATKALRPWHCNGGIEDEQGAQAQAAFNIYVAVLAIFSPDSTANQAGCYK